MQGNCNSPPDAEVLGIDVTNTGLGDWRTGQCVVVTNGPLLFATQNLWLHNMYIRHQGKDVFDSVLRCVGEGCSLWMTDVTIQSDGAEESNHGVLSVNGGHMYGEGVTSRHSHVSDGTRSLRGLLLPCR